MNEKGIKRREWIKTAAIIFLSVMLVLTFFSQTIMNYSLPEVATKYVQNGSITSKIRGSGMVESGDPYTIEIPATEVGRKVSSIHVKVGDKVEKGDVLMYLAEGDGEELENAKAELLNALEVLRGAQERYDNAILMADITASDINSANANISAATYRTMITNKQTALQAAKEKVNPLATSVKQLEQAIADCNTQISFEEQQKGLAASRVETAQNALNMATIAQTTAQSEADGALTARNTIQAESDALESDITAGLVAAEDIDAKRADVAARLASAEQTLATKQAALVNANSALTNATNEYNAAVANKEQKEASQTVNNITGLRANYELTLHATQKDLTAAQEEVSKLQDELNDLVSKITDISNLETMLNDISSAQTVVNDKQKKVNELEEKAGATAIYADITGTITAINVSSGKKIQSQDVMVLQPKGQGYYMTMSVTTEQSRNVSVGDRASLVNSWYYNDLDIVLESIRPDKTDPAKMKQLTFSVTGDVTAGQNLSISVGQKSQNYDCIVPNSAIKEDNNGKFILIVESKSSPLGNRYVATRVDVQVVASDDTQSAVSGALTGWEYVITTSTKPLQAGDLVRFSEN